MKYVVTFGDGTRITVEADSPGVARAKAQDKRFHKGLLVLGVTESPINNPSWKNWSIESVKPLTQ